MKKNIKIFILDDDHFYGTLLKNAIAKPNREVHYFDSEMEFIRRLSERPEIIILDHKLKQCTGLQILNLLSKKRNLVTNVIYVSAQGLTSSTSQSLEMGAVDYIDKGVVPIEDVEKSIQKILSYTNNFQNSPNIRPYNTASSI